MDGIHVENSYNIWSIKEMKKIILNYTNNSIEDLANILYDFTNKNKPKTFKKLYKKNTVILKVDENIKLYLRDEYTS